MASKQIFHGPAQIEIQGPRVLRLEREPAPTDPYVEFQLIAFVDPVVKILDYRRASLEVLQGAFSTWEHHLFTPRFNQPAEVTLWSPKPGDVQIDLRETADVRPDYILWMAVGMDQNLPVYNYIYRDIAQIDDDRCALLSIYERPRPRVASQTAYTRVP
jgi:hypothetical protein